MLALAKLMLIICVQMFNQNVAFLPSGTYTPVEGSGVPQYSDIWHV